MRYRRFVGKGQGKPGALSRYVLECKSGLRPPALRYLKKLKNVKSAV